MTTRGTANRAGDEAAQWTEGMSERQKTGEADEGISAEGTAGKTKGGAEGKPRRDKGKSPWISRGLLVSAALAVAVFCLYGFFRDRAEVYKSSPLEDYNNMAWLYQNCYLLYKDLYNAQTDEQKNYKELFMQPKEEYDWIMEPDVWEEGSEAFQERFDSMEGETEEGLYANYYDLKNGMSSADSYFQELENCFGILNNNYDYVIRDNQSGFYLTNMSAEDLERSIEEQFFQISFEFNEFGVVMVGEDITGVDAAQIRKLANEAIRFNSLNDFLEINASEDLLHYITLNSPVDCTVTYRISQKDWASGKSGGRLIVRSIDGGMNYSTSVVSYGRTTQVSAYRESHMGVILLSFLTIALAAGCFLPVKGVRKPWRDVKICSLPLEPLLAVGIVIYAWFGELIFSLVIYTAGGEMKEMLGQYLNFELQYVAMALINIVCLTAFFFCGWYLGICARAVRELGIKGYIKQRCIFYRIFPFIKGRALGFYHAVCHFDVTRNAHKMILKIVLLNAVILFVISCFWVTGFPLTVVYSVLLYVLLRKYISELQKKYGLLLYATNEIAEGNLNVTITEDLGVFEPFKPQVIRIQNGFKNAVEEEVKSQRMKAELITNVSHDLKTPLTAIITYINLLKDESVTEGQRREYLDTLERKSLRLKVLIEDLFEVSKANSQAVTLNIMDVDIMNLVKQVSFEMADKLAASNLDVRINLTDEKIILPLDSQKTYRIYENLMGNIAKYALPGTRVYINGFRIDDTVILTLKNISAQEITVDTAELTERFVRGDASRNTEGSGLGLAIAKSFMELQGGELSLEVDGDLFKATTTWHI